MSTELTPGTKVENAVYAGFGIALGLMIFRITVPSVFLDVRGLVAAALLSASIIGALFFYGRPERGLISWYRKRILKMKLFEMAIFLIRVRAAYRVWFRSIEEDWLTIEEECDEVLESAMNGKDLYDDMWKLRGGMYFLIGVLFLLISITYPAPQSIQIATLPIGVSLLLFTACEITVAVALIVDFWNFPLRCSSVAIFRMLQDIHSIVTQQMPPSAPEIDMSMRPNTPQTIVLPMRTLNREIGVPGNRSSLERALEEIDTILNRQEWKRFERRFNFLAEDSRFKTREVQNEIELYYLQALISYYKTPRNTENRKIVELLEKQARLLEKVRRTKTDCFLGIVPYEAKLHFQMVKLGENLTNQYEIHYFRDEIVEALWLITETDSKEITLEEIETVLNWYKQRYVSDIKPLVKLAGSFINQETPVKSEIDDKTQTRHQVAQEIFDAIKNHEFDTAWQYITPELLSWVLNQDEPELNHIVAYAPYVWDGDLLLKTLRKHALTNDSLIVHLALSYHDEIRIGITSSSVTIGVYQFLSELKEPEKFLERILDLFNLRNPEAISGAIQLLNNLLSLNQTLILKVATQISRNYENAFTELEKSPIASYLNDETRRLARELNDMLFPKRGK